MTAPNPPGITRDGQPCSCSCHAVSAAGLHVRHFVACCSPAIPPAGIRPNGQPCRCICHNLPGIDHPETCCEVLP